MDLRDIDLESNLGQTVCVRGVLLAKGNFQRGGECTLVPNWESIDEPTTVLPLLPEGLILTLLEKLPACGGGEYSLAYDVDISGRLTAEDRDVVKLRVERLTASTMDGEVVVDVA